MDERKEDLNPHSSDIEERVKQMLDLSVDDEPKSKPAAAPKKTGKAISVEDFSEDSSSEATGILLSAPELPSSDKKIVSSTAKAGSKKVIMPITYPDDDDVKAAAVSAQDPEAPEKKITIAEDNDSPQDIADKIDQTIAGIEAIEAGDKPPAAKTEVISDMPKTAKPEPAPGDGADIPVLEPEVVADPATEKAVDDIIAKESDQLLEMEDAARDKDTETVAEKMPHKKRQRNFKAWLAKPAVRRGMAGFALLILLAIGTIPNSRYFALNTAGIRVGSSLIVLDDSTRQPLKNVQVKMGEASALTDVNGRASFNKVRLGKNNLTIEKRAFAPVARTITIGLGSNPLGDIRLTPTGSQYSFKVTDFLSAKAIAKAEATSGDASAIADEKGVIKLTLDKLTDGPIKIEVSSNGYRTEQIVLNPDNKEVTNTKMVSARKHFFVTKRSGKYDIYSIYTDGKQEELVLAGSGKERDDMVLVPHPTDNIAAYVSTRSGQTNKDGFVLSNLILINTEDYSTTNIKSSERIQIVDWSKDYLVYVQIAAGTSASSPNRYRLMSYNYKEQEEKELASSNFFNDVVFAGGAIYYAPSGAYQSGAASFHKVSPDGTGGRVVFNKEVWNIFRTTYDHLALSVQQQWYDYSLGSTQPTKLNSAPANQTSRVYIDSPDGKHSAWIDSRDGKGVLLIYDAGTKTDKQLQSHTGMTYPTRWLNNDVLVYRVKSPQETADYAISLEGGEPVKIRDVTNSGGIDRWYYY